MGLLTASHSYGVSELRLCPLEAVPLKGNQLGCSSTFLALVSTQICS